MENHCIACGMPLKNKEDIGLEIDKGSLCKHCINDDGSAKNCKEIFEGGVQFFMNSTGADKNLAERLTRKNMNDQSYWHGKNNECLNGDEATDEEFQTALDKLHNE